MPGWSIATGRVGEYFGDGLPLVNLSVMRFTTLFIFAFTASGATAAPVADYARDVRPILAKNCYECHGAKAQKGGIRVDTVKGLMLGGDSGPAVVPGKSTDSLIVQALSGAEGVTTMPLKRPALSADEIHTIKVWIDAGARAHRLIRRMTGLKGASTGRLSRRRDHLYRPFGIQAQKSTMLSTRSYLPGWHATASPLHRRPIGQR